MDFANKDSDEELTEGENDVDEAMLEELADDADLEEGEELLPDAAVLPVPALPDEEDEESDGEEEDALFEEDAEDVDFDSFDDVDHL